ncbi:hypothetical protein [Clostridium perfringens]|uniref:hypothetical protein n=1 Tax=Clostridium perfringens TaxID=1502 RepID=UPI000F54A287|nr:hypothetical protein [Clostridium perfringens]
MKKYEKMVVIFVDLLGTKNNTKFEDKYKIHRIFHGEARINESRKLDHVVYDRKVFTFSDCAYFFYYYKEGIEDSRKNDMKLIEIALNNTAISLLRILNAGYLIRGGVTFGDVYFDELGFFGPGVEEAYKLESNYADMPIIAIEPKLGEKLSSFIEKNTDMNLVNMLFTSKPEFIEKYKDKYFFNIFYELETFSPVIQLETECIYIEDIKENLFNIINRDKEKYMNQDEFKIKNKSTIYEKLDWMEKYLIGKKNKSNNNVSGAFSMIVDN